VRQTQLHPSISLDPVSETCKPPHTCQGKRSLNGIMAIISKIWSQSALEHDLSLRCLVLDAVPNTRARTGARPRTPRALVRASPRPCSPAPLKPPPSAPHLTTCSPSLARNPFLSSSELSSAHHHCPSLGHRGQLAPAMSKLCLSLISFASGPWIFLSSRTRHNLTGDLRASSPDFGRLWTRVDRAIH
jgi:hypothetical protein